jgi:hypothetical protein
MAQTISSLDLASPAVRDEVVGVQVGFIEQMLITHKRYSRTVSYAGEDSGEKRTLIHCWWKMN